MPLKLYDPRRGTPAVTVDRIVWTPGTTVEPARRNTFSVYWVESGSGRVSVDLTEHTFGRRTLIFASPYRRLRFSPARTVRGSLVSFHANFLCVETFHAESGCSGVLFNDPYGTPLVPVGADASDDIAALTARIERELTLPRAGGQEVVLSTLKILLVLATRMKQTTATATTGRDYRHPLFARVTELIEEHYRQLHGPADYAKLLNVTPKALGRIARAHLGKTMSEAIRERVLIDAKWELLHTLKPVKQVAGELGFSDELYFSRLFRKATGLSPTAFREFETRIRGGSNLSMTLARPTIPPARQGD